LMNRLLLKHKKIPILDLSPGASKRAIRCSVPFFMTPFHILYKTFTLTGYDIEN
jgi:hypothetical protein